MDLLYAFSDNIAKILGLDISVSPDHIMFYHKCTKSNYKNNSDTGSDSESENFSTPTPTPTPTYANYICLNCLESGLYYQNIENIR